MHAPLTPHETARLRQLALARAAQLRAEALDRLWAQFGGPIARLWPRGAAGARRLRLG